MGNLKINNQDLKNLFQSKSIAFTFDIDWASEDVIKYCFDYFEKQEIPVTIFMTHRSEYLESKFSHSNYCFGIHPNFIEGSSQGKNYSEIIDFCKKLKPDVLGSRSHRYFDMNDTNELLHENGIRWDSNTCTHLEVIRPFMHRTGILRFPIFLEDGGYLRANGDLNFNKVKSIFNVDGILVINIHPMHMFMNSPTFEYSRNKKDNISREKMHNISLNDIDIFRYNGLGIETFIKELVEYVKEKKYRLWTLEDLYNEISDTESIDCKSEKVYAESIG